MNKSIENLLDLFEDDRLAQSKIKSWAKQNVETLIYKHSCTSDQLHNMFPDGKGSHWFFQDIRRSAALSLVGAMTEERTYRDYNGNDLSIENIWDNPTIAHEVIITYQLWRLK